jgi:hypothetical protein
MGMGVPFAAISAGEISGAAGSSASILAIWVCE